MTDPLPLQRILGPVVDDNLDEIEAGFSTARAREILRSPEKLDYLLWTVARVDPGAGWLESALEDSERGRLNRDLLGRALAARSEAGHDGLVVTTDGQSTTIAPRWWPGNTEGAFVAPLPFADGTLFFDPGDVTRIPAATFTGVTPSWLGALTAIVAAVGVESGVARAAEPVAHGVDDAARAALGLWLARWNPALDRDLLLDETNASLSACGADPLVAAPLGRAHLALAAGAGDADAEFVSAVLAFRREPDPDDTSPGRAFRAEIAVDDHS